MIAGASTGQGPPDPLRLPSQPVRQIAVLTSDCVLVCNNQDAPYAQAVKMHALVFRRVQSGISSYDDWEKRVENMSPNLNLIRNRFRVKAA